jgi:hypothetical protein
MTLTRRRFLKGTGAGVAVGAALRAEARPAPGRLPTRVLGKTGVRVSILAMAAAAASSCT